MFRNHLKTALRNLWRNKGYAVINIFGLAVGLAVVILIYLFIRHEFSYENFHTNAENIYRINEVSYEKDGVTQKKGPLGYRVPTEGIQSWSWLPLALGDAIQENLPEVQQFCRIDEDGGVVRYGNKVFEEEFRFADTNFFSFFTFPLLRGDPDRIFQQDDEVVITAAIADKYFGRNDPVGEVLMIQTFQGEKPFTVVGIAETPPSNSSILFDFVLPIRNKPFYERQYANWNSHNTPLFVELATGTTMENFEGKLDEIETRYFTDMMDRTRTRLGLEEDAKVFDLNLTPLRDMHLETAVQWWNQGSQLNIMILGGLAMLILIIACLNYISLALVTTSGRVREVGIRKVMGSTPGLVSRQFWLEAQLLVIGATFVGIVFAEIFLPVFNDFVQRDLTFSVTQNPEIFLPLILIAMLTGIAAGGYPAWRFSRYRPVQVLRSNATYRAQPGFIRGAVLTQFALSAFLIVATLVIHRQMQYINEKDLGFDKEQTLVIPTYTGWSDEGEQLMNLMKQQLAADPAIASISGTSSSFSQGWSRNGFHTPDGEEHIAYVYRVAHNYLQTLGIELLAGRDFSPEHPSDSLQAVIVNEKLVEDLGFEDPIGENVPWLSDQNQTIVGVVKDYHFLSLNHPIDPVILHMNSEQGKIVNLLVKIRGNEIPGAIRRIESSWKEVVPNNPFNFSFLDEDVANQYAAYQRWMRIVGVSSIFAIFIACLGLFGLAGILALNRTREIGIRKVLGAGLSNILILLNKDLVRMALLAILIAGPVSWYVMRGWLDNFEFHITLGWGVFMLSAALCIVIALAAVSYHTIKVASANPVKALRDQ